MKIVKGDLIQLALSGNFDLIIHGCNCFCSMGKGIALSIKNEFPEAFQADQVTIYGRREKLGMYSHATVMRNGHVIVIINAYTQYHWRGKGDKVDYQATEAVFRLIKRDFPGLSIGYPLIGAGLAGGDWQKISGIIDSCLVDEDHTLVEYDKA